MKSLLLTERMPALRARGLNSGGVVVEADTQSQFGGCVASGSAGIVAVERLQEDTIRVDSELFVVPKTVA
jgi:hypothetical protein